MHNSATTTHKSITFPVARRRVGGDRYRDQVMSLVAKRGFAVSDTTHEQDMKEASDLLLDGQGCALRIRTEKALLRWPDEFTIRAWRPCCGSDTELQKILSGHARYALYGFTDRSDKIVLLRLLDMDVFRQCLTGRSAGKYDRDMQIGTDGVGYFVFNLHEFPATFVKQVWDYRH